MKNTRSDKGITLVALIITIIVLLILAVVAISAVSGDGILNKAKDAARETKMAQEAEALRIAVNEWKIQSSIPGNEETLAGFLAAKLPEAAVTDDGYGGATVVFPNSMYIVSANGEIIKDTSTSATGGVEETPVDLSEIEIGDFKYSLNEDGTAGVLGLSAQGKSKVPYYAEPVELLIPDEIEYEGQRYIITRIISFYGVSKLILTSLPSKITSIGEYAFWNCVNLALTSLPDGITTIERGAFFGCDNLALTSLPSGITSISAEAFLGCDNLALTSLPSGVTYIGQSAFSGCTNLALTSLPNNLDIINAQAFDRCTSLSEITFEGIPDSIGGEVISATGEPTGLYAGAFTNCTNLTTMRVPWSEGAVANAPWGATNATVTYNYTGQ